MAQLDPEIIEMIRRRYAETGNKSLVAEELGINRKSVRRYVETSKAPVDLAALVALLDAYNAMTAAPTVPTAPVHPTSRNAVLGGFKRVLALFDSHHPYHNQKAIDAVLEFAKDWGPDLVVLAGDHLDCHAISRFDKDPSRCYHLQDEVDSIEPTLAAIEKLKAQVVWLDGNHEHRLMKLVGVNPSLYNLRGMSIPEVLKFPKEWQYYPSQSHVKVGDLIILHGDLAGRNTSHAYPAVSMLGKLGVNCLFGHSHRSATHSATCYDGTIQTAHACGHLCDPSKMSYIRVPDWQSSIATILVDKNGRSHVQQYFCVNDSFYIDDKEFPHV